VPNNTKIYNLTSLAVLIAVSSIVVSLIGIVNIEKLVLGQSKATSISIMKGASNPSVTEPYRPSPVTVTIGTVVTWTNNDNTGHTVTEGSPSGNTPTNGFDSGILAPGKTFTHTFDESGTVQYYCTLHPTMSGEIIVK
jgi:plastocyanin